MAKMTHFFDFEQQELFKSKRLSLSLARGAICKPVILHAFGEKIPFFCIKATLMYPKTCIF
jgi:hypothetical protein